MNAQANTTQRTSPRNTHAYILPVVRELPSLPGSAPGSARDW
jgi:hypothetical protein